MPVQTISNCTIRLSEDFDFNTGQSLVRFDVFKGDKLKEHVQLGIDIGLPDERLANLLRQLFKMANDKGICDAISK
jgi:hypothetical protein